MGVDGLSTSSNRDRLRAVRRGNYRRKLTPEQAEMIASLRSEGLAPRVIAERFGVSEGLIKYYCLRNGIDPPKNSAKRLPPVPQKSVIYRRADGHLIRRFSAEEDQLLLRLEAQGCNYNAIARTMGRTRNTVISRLACLARRDERELG